MSDDIIIEFRPPDLLKRMERYPDQLHAELERTTQQALYHVQGSVPSYPAQLPTSYVRTGTLGRTIGLGGRAEVFKVERIGSTGYQATLGTRLEYAPYVIGSPGPGKKSQTAEMKRRNWWTTKDIAEKARPGVQRLYAQASQRMAKWLVGRR